MKQLLTLLLCLPWLSGCCTAKILSTGKIDHTSPYQAERVAGYRGPLAVKDAAGDVVFEYDTVHYRTTLMGRRALRSSWTLLRVTNTIPKGELKPMPITNRWGQKFVFPNPGSETASVGNGGVLTLKERCRDENGDWVYPNSECVIDVGDWIWYQPPQLDGEPGRAAVLSSESCYFPLTTVPTKIVSVPLFLTMDAVSVVVYPVFAYMFLAAGYVN